MTNPLMSTASSSSSSSSSPSPVLVLGGTGKTGRRVADGLRRRGFTPRVASRSGEVRFDWYDEGSWDPALNGVGAVYVVDSQGPGAGDEVRAFAARAAALGVTRLVLLSARIWAEVDHESGRLLATERAVRESGLEWTILRPSWFNQNFTEETGFYPLLTEGELRLPTGEGREPFIDLEDLADVAVAALTEEGHAGQTYVLSGPEAMTLREVVAALADATGRELAYHPVTDDEYRVLLAERGHPAEYVEFVIGLFGHVRASKGAELSDGVRRALGREPQEFGAYVARTDFASFQEHALQR
ncbi:NAD(P)H-binding protein [Streptomyces jumonjinensis]|uniref:NAD(P)H-binding protein n=1 Tax=Streptomyces jumonjinensis TaxID=1945 RepID=UPI00378969D3